MLRIKRCLRTWGGAEQGTGAGEHRSTARTALGVRLLEKRLELRASIRLPFHAAAGARERLAREVEVLAEIPARLLGHRIGLGLGARVVVALVVMTAVSAAAHVAAARRALRIARNGLVDVERCAAQVADERGHAGSIGRPGPVRKHSPRPARLA